jgi:hypothetical protein
MRGAHPQNPDIKKPPRRVVMGSSYGFRQLYLNPTIRNPKCQKKATFGYVRSGDSACCQADGFLFSHQSVMIENHTTVFPRLTKESAF